MSVTCEQVRPLLSADFDRELDVTKSLEIAAHVRECRHCSASVEHHVALHAALGGASLAFPSPTGLERRVRQALRRESRRTARFTLLPWRWAAVPAIAALAAVLSWNVGLHQGSPSGEDALLAELVSSHVRSLMVDHLVDVATSDQHTVKPWFNGKVDFAPPVIDLTSSGFPLVGGRVDYIAGRPVAVVVYKRSQHAVNVFVWPTANAGGAALSSRTFQGYHLLQWTGSGLTFWAVSDVNSADVERLAQLLQTSG